MGAAEGKSEGGRRQGRAHTPLPWHRPPLCGWALPPGAAARSCRGVGDGAGFLGVQTLAAGRSKGEKFISPSEAESVLTRKWLCEGDRIGEAGHWVLKAPLLPAGRNGGLTIEMTFVR